MKSLAEIFAEENRQIDAALDAMLDCPEDEAPMRDGSP